MVIGERLLTSPLFLNYRGWKHGRLDCSCRHSRRFLAVVLMKRLIRNVLLFCVGLVLGGASVYSFADTAPTKTWHWPWGGGSFGSVAAVCAADIGLPNWPQSYPGCTFTCQNVVQGDMSGTYTVHTFCNSQQQSDTGRSSQATMDCASGMVLNQTTNMCVSAPNCTAGQKDNLEFFAGWVTTTGRVASTVSPPASTCYGGCNHVSNFKVVDCYSYPNRASPLKSYCTFEYQTDGSSCSNQNPYQESDSAPPCPPGYSSGTINGTAACLPSSGTATSSSNTTTTKTTNGNGSTTTTTTTTNPDSSKSTTTTTTDAAGNSTSSTQNTPPQDPLNGFCTNNPNSPLCKASTPSKFCEDNPTATICENRTSSGGDTCDDAPSCDGDAIDCAVLKQDWQIRCEARNQAKVDPLGVEGMNIVSGSDPLASQFPTMNNGQTVDLSTKLNHTEIYAASCPPPAVFSLQGHSFSIDYGPLCHFGEIIGQIAVIFSTMGAAYILGRG